VVAREGEAAVGQTLSSVGGRGPLERLNHGFSEWIWDGCSAPESVSEMPQAQPSRSIAVWRGRGWDFPLLSPALFLYAFLSFCLQLFF